MTRHPSGRVILPWLVRVTFPILSCFATAAPAQGGAAQPPAPSAGAALEVLAALAAVLAAFMLLAWLLRRLGPGRQSAGGVMRVVGGVAVGPRERVVLLEVGETWLVVGVAPGSVTALHSMPRPAHAAAAPEEPAPPGFARRLQAALKPHRGTGPGA